MGGINGCYCRTKWYQYSEPLKRKCKKPPEDVTDKLQKALDKELEQKRSELDSKVAGDMELKYYFDRDGGTVPGTDTPTFTEYKQVCTTNDWFRYRNLKGSFKPSPKPECEDWPDKSSITYPYDGETYVTYQECDCAKTKSGGVFDGEAQAVETEEILGTESIPTTVEIKIEWEEWEGISCGERVEADSGQDAPDPRENYKGKSIERSSDFTLEWVKYNQIIRFRQNFWIDHTCP